LDFNGCGLDQLNALANLEAEDDKGDSPIDDCEEQERQFSD
jgi:hypothetical protein